MAKTTAMKTPKATAPVSKAPVAKTVAAKTVAAKTVAVKTPVAKPAAKSSAFMKPLQPSAALAAVFGSKAPLARTEAVKLLWAYIKRHNLQNPANKRNILCDAKLLAVMGKAEVTMFEMTGLVGKHLAAA